MKADLTRNTFDPLKHYTRVLMQQGRVQLDADWNEQASIGLRYLRALAADVIGLQGGPADNLGFAISDLTVGFAVTAVAGDFLIGAGHYYVDGILCEVDSVPIPITGSSTSPPKQITVLYWPLDDLSFQTGRYVEIKSTAGSLLTQITLADPRTRSLTLNPDVTFDVTNGSIRLLTTYRTQPDYPVPEGEQIKGDSNKPSYMVYLDVWERHITYVEDDAIRETALDGPDTATRAKLVCQVKAKAGEIRSFSGSPCDDYKKIWDPFLAELRGNHGFLKARAKQNVDSTDPCVISPDSRYRGPENQLYRVEIHTRGKAWNKPDPPGADDAPATFKWSRENGSVVFPIASGLRTKTLVLESLGRDDRFGLAEGDWVEIQDDVSILQNRITPLLQVQSIERSTRTVTLSDVADLGNDPKHPLLRRWDQKAGDPKQGGLLLTKADHADHAALIIETGEKWLDLEDGVQIQFQPADTDQSPIYNTGDYWLIPARTATGDVEWPTDIPSESTGTPVRVQIALPPAGVKHHYAPLAVIKVDAGKVTTLLPGCQKTYDTLAKKE